MEINLEDYRPKLIEGFNKAWCPFIYGSYDEAYAKFIKQLDEAIESNDAAKLLEIDFINDFYATVNEEIVNSFFESTNKNKEGRLCK